MVIDKEVWKSIEGYPKYEISSIGLIKSKYKNKFLSNKSYTGRYVMCWLSNETNSKKMFLVHRLVAKAFIPNPENKPEVNHKNGIKTDNRVENLEWVTRSENEKHAIINGKTYPRGDNHYRSILKDSDVIKIRSFLKTGLTQSYIANQFGVTQSTISDIKIGRRRQHSI